jgi:hypothetical protein
MTTDEALGKINDVLFSGRQKMSRMTDAEENGVMDVLETLKYEAYMDGRMDVSEWVLDNYGIDDPGPGSL